MSIIATLASPQASKISGGYKTSKNQFPQYEKVDPKDKQQPEYCIDVARAGYSALMNDRMFYPSFSYDYIQQLRDYGIGRQDPQYYINKLKEVNPGGGNSGDTSTNNSSGESKRKGMYNLNDQVISIAVNLKNALHGVMESYEEDIFIDAVDNDSVSEENKAMFEAIFDTEMQSFTKAMEEQYGVPLSSAQSFPSDITVDEIIDYKETGGFKTFWAENMEEVIHYTELISDWSTTIKRKFIDDGIDINFMAARCVFDHSAQKEKWEYVDPANFAIQYSIEKNFKDAEYAGYFSLEKIGTLVSYGFSSDELITAAKKYEYLFENPKNVDWGSYKWTDGWSNKLFDFKIPVFHFSWVDVDVKKHAKYTNTYGKTTIRDINFDEELEAIDENGQKKGIKNEYMNTRMKRAYQCSWVVDTDMGYNYGLVPNQTKESQLPFKAWRGVSGNSNMVFGSIIESIVPFLDHLQLAWMKYQDALAKSHPGGYAINIRLLQHLKLGGKKIEPLDAYKMFWETGRFPYMDVPIGEDYKGGAVTPLTRIEGTTGELMQVFEHEIQFVSAMIDKLTGITPVSLGALPDKDTPVATQQMASTGTSNVIKPMISGMFEIKRSLADMTSKRIPLLFKNIVKVREAYGRIIGDDGVEVIKNAYRNGAEYGLSMEVRPDAEAKQRLYEMVQTALSRSRDGEASIDLDQAMYIREQIEAGGNLKKLQRKVALDLRKAKEEAFAKQQALIDRQSQQQSQQKAAQQQGEMQIKQQDLQLAIALEDAKTKNEAYLEQLKANLDYKKSLMDRRSDLIKQKQTEKVSI